MPPPVTQNIASAALSFQDIIKIARLRMECKMSSLTEIKFEMRESFQGLIARKALWDVVAVDERLGCA